MPGHESPGGGFWRDPAPGDLRVVVADVHGNHVLLKRLLQAAGALDEAGRRLPGTWAVQLGDLIHGAQDLRPEAPATEEDGPQYTAAAAPARRDTLQSDAGTLRLAFREGWLDGALIGNHELPYLTSRISGAFAGMHRRPDGVPEHPSCQADLAAALRDGFFRPAAAVDGWLLTHAGLSPEHALDGEGRVTDAELAAACAAGAGPAADLICERFLERLTGGREPEGLTDGISPWRQGTWPAGSVFWADAREITAGIARHGPPAAQVAGHTPFANSRVTRIPWPARPGDTGTWLIDLAGIDDGYGACLIKRAGDEDWTPVVVPRPRRPGRILDAAGGRWTKAAGRA